MKTCIALPLLLATVTALSACGPQPIPLPEIWNTWPEAPEAPQPLLSTVWKLRDLPGNGEHTAVTVSPESHVGFIILEADGKHLTGYAGCQPMTALYQQQGATLNIEGLVRTGSRCHKDSMDDIGDRFATALSTATGYRMASDDALLYLLAGDTVTATLIYRTPPKGHW